MKKTALTLTGTAIAALAIAAPAAAHDGDHSMAVFTAIGHWLASPSHALFSVVGAVAFIALAAKFARNKA